MPVIRMRVAEELWLMPTGDPLCPWEISRPLITRRGGAGMPGLLQPDARPFVLRPGVVIHLEAPGLYPPPVHST